MFLSFLLLTVLIGPLISALPPPLSSVLISGTTSLTLQNLTSFSDTDRPVCLPIADYPLPVNAKICKPLIKDLADRPRAGGATLFTGDSDYTVPGCPCKIGLRAPSPDAREVFLHGYADFLRQVHLIFSVCRNGGTAKVLSWWEPWKGWEVIVEGIPAPPERDQRATARFRG